MLFSSLCLSFPSFVLESVTATSKGYHLPVTKCFRKEISGVQCSCHHSPCLNTYLLLGCREFAAGLRWWGTGKEAGTTPPAQLQLQGCLKVSESALSQRGTSESFLSLHWQAAWGKLTDVGLTGPNTLQGICRKKRESKLSLSMHQHPGKERVMHRQGVGSDEKQG